MASLVSAALVVRHAVVDYSANSGASTGSSCRSVVPCQGRHPRFAHETSSAIMRLLHHVNALLLARSGTMRTGSIARLVALASCVAASLGSHVRTRLNELQLVELQETVPEVGIVDPKPLGDEEGGTIAEDEVVSHVRPGASGAQNRYHICVLAERRVQTVVPRVRARASLQADSSSTSIVSSLAVI